MIYITPKDENLSAEIAVDATHEIFRFTVPARAKGFITHFGNYIKDFDAWGSITWIFKKNGVPVYRYHEIKDQLGWGAQLRELSPIEICGADVFTIDIHNGYLDVMKCGVAIKYEIHEGE